jgi:hypothetical protein
MVADSRQRARPCTGFDDDEIDAHGQARRRGSVRQADLQQPADRSANVAALAVIERLLRQAEGALTAPADLDDHECRWRTRVDRHDIELVATDMDVPGEDGPSRCDQTRTDEGLSGVTRLLRRRPGPS